MTEGLISKEEREVNQEVNRWIKSELRSGLLNHKTIRKTKKIPYTLLLFVYIAIYFFVDRIYDPPLCEMEKMRQDREEVKEKKKKQMCLNPRRCWSLFSGSVGIWLTKAKIEDVSSVEHSKSVCLLQRGCVEQFSAGESAYKLFPQ